MKRKEYRHRLLRYGGLSAVVLATVLSLGSCHKEYDDYSTTAVITLETTGVTKIQRIPGTAVMTNLNNKQQFSSSDFDGTTIYIDVFRGAYSADVEGALVYTDSIGQEQTKMFRASTSYCEAISHPAPIRLKLIYL
ncbi:MAG: hypothetical protein LUC45_02310 [Paraprevotella sp.]|nr:hypothetical protein [Paraprevotella sp.]